MQNALDAEHDSPTPRPRSVDEARPDPIEALLIESGLIGLSTLSTTVDQESVLQALAGAIAGLTPLRRVIVRDRAIQALKRGGFESPARLVDAALSGALVDAPSSEAGSDLLLAAPQPCAETVDGAALLNQIEAAIVAHAV
ncbi:MAG TPA: hypothetical protein VNG33_19255, partial [Polyangiaceae bacterium]|nr:hypothetical protein [Polyangiaceae bacterium]